MALSETSTVALTSCEGLPGAYILYELLQRGCRVRVPVLASITMERLQGLWKAVYGSSPNTENIHWLEGSLQDWETCEAFVEGADSLILAPDLFVLSMKADRHDMNMFLQLISRLVDMSLGSAPLQKLVYISSTAAFSRAEPEVEITKRLPWKDHRNNTFFNKALMKAELEIWRGNAEGLKTGILHSGYMIGYSSWPNFLDVITTYEGPLKGRHGFVDVRDVARAAVQLLDSDHSGIQEFLIAESLSFETLRRIARENYSGVFANTISGSNSLRERGWLRWFRLSYGEVSPFLVQDFGMSLSFRNEDVTSGIQLEYTDIEDSLSFFAGVVRQIHSLNN
jgi:nucleoside-diphosphate-sugar epimerase